MQRCSGIKPSGGRCERIVSQEHTYCYSHDPTRQAERKRNAARGGKAKAAGEIGGIKTEIHNTIEAVQSGYLDKGIGAVVFQGYGMLLRAVSVGLDVQERLDLLDRMEKLEEGLQRRKEADRRWPA
jgi:hypothetical protein